MKKIFITLLVVGAVLGILTSFINGFNFSMAIFKLLSFGLYYITLYIGLIKDRDFFSPFSLFCVSPFVALIYNNFIGDRYLPLLTDYPIFLTLLGNGCFILGLYLYRQSKDIEGFHKDKKYIKPFVNYSNWILIGLGLFPTAFAVAINPFNIDFTVQGIAKFRADFNIPILSSLVCFSNAALINAAMMKKKTLFAAFAFFVLIAGAFTQTRGSIIMLFLIILYCLYRFWNRKYSKVVITIGIVIVFFVIQIYGLIRSANIEHNSFSSYEYFEINHQINRVPRALQPLFPTFMYLTMPLSNFDYIVNNFDDYTMGKLTFWVFSSTFQIKRVFDLETIIKPIRILPFNTHMFLTDFYMDYGIFGVIILPTLLGLFVYFMYYRSLKENNSIMHAEYMYMGFATLLTFFSNHFTSIGYPLRTFVIFETYRIIYNTLRKS